MFCRHVIGNISGGFRGISRVLGISRDFAEIPEFRRSATAGNIRSPDNSIFHRQKKLLFVYLTGQNWGLSRLKNMWQVIMTGDVLSVILNIVR